MIKIDPVLKEAIEREQFKSQRKEAVANITVTTSSGLVFDGDEASQGRMVRTIIALDSQPAGSTVRWVLSDNSIADVGLSELNEALALAAKQQNEIWVNA